MKSQHPIEAMPPIRYRSLEDALRRRNAVPSHLIEGDKCVPNPEYAEAQFEERFEMHEPQKK